MTASPGTTSKPKQTKSPGLLPFQLVMAVFSGALGGIIAILGELRDYFDFSETSIGIIVSAGFLAAFVAQVGVGAQADRGRARIMVIAGVVLALASVLIMTVAQQASVWILARALYGFGTGLVFPGLRRAASVLDRDRVGENLGRLIVGEVGGFLVGPVVAGFLVYLGGIRLPFIVLSVIMAIFLPFVWRLPADNGEIDKSPRLLAIDLLKRRRLVASLTLVAGYFLLIGGFEAVLPVMYNDRGASSLVTGIAFSSFALPLMLVSTKAGRLADRVGPPRLAIGGITIVALTAALYGILPGYIWPAVLMLFGGFADGVGFTAAQVAVARAVPESRQAGALGLMGATEVLSAGVAAVPASLAYQHLGAELTWLGLSAATLTVVILGSVLFRGTQPVERAGPVLPVNLI